MSLILLAACTAGTADSGELEVSGTCLREGVCPLNASAEPLVNVEEPHDVLEVWLTSTTAPGVWFTPERGLQFHPGAGGYAVIVPECGDTFRVALRADVCAP